MTYGIDTVRQLRAAPGAMRSPPPRSGLDLATVAGILAAFLLIVAAIVLGGSPGAFFNLPALFIVFGGTFGVTVACFSIKDIAIAIRVLSQAVHRVEHDAAACARHVMQLADLARRRGLLSLQEHLPALMNSGLLYRGVAMAVDGSPAEEVERIMQREVQAAAQRNARTVGVLRKAAEVSPAMGLIGTLVGLVQMLGNLEDPSAIGPGMAVALLTTFYGAVLANLVFTPLAAKLERNAIDETLVNQLYVLAAVSIARQENPRRLEMLLNTVLPPDHRIAFYR